MLNLKTPLRLFLLLALLMPLAGDALADDSIPPRSTDLVRVPEPLPKEPPSPESRPQGAALVIPEEPLPGTLAAPPEPLPEHSPRRPGEPSGEIRAAESQILDTLESWLTAWWTQDADRYLAFYAEDFQAPENLDRDAWERLRRERLAAPSFINLRIEPPDVTAVSAQRFRARFVQHYRSDSYQDTVVKTLDLTRENGGWKILQEESQPIPAPSVQARL